MVIHCCFCSEVHQWENDLKYNKTHLNINMFSNQGLSRDKDTFAATDVGLNEGCWPKKGGVKPCLLRFHKAFQRVKSKQSRTWLLPMVIITYLESVFFFRNTVPPLCFYKWLRSFSTPLPSLRGNLSIYNLVQASLPFQAAAQVYLLPWWQWSNPPFWPSTEWHNRAGYWEPVIKWRQFQTGRCLDIDKLTDKW